MFNIPVNTVNMAAMYQKLTANITRVLHVNYAYVVIQNSVI